MKKILISLLVFLVSNNAATAQDNKTCSAWPSWTQLACHRLHQIWTEGKNELYLSGYAWHNRFTYTKERLATHQYNEEAWGGGLGKGFYDEKGDWHGLYALTFLDSHKKLEPAAGYAFLKIRQFGQNTRIGAGYSLIATVRSDVFKGIPFVGIIPWVSINYLNLSLSATYVPGRKDNGNVLFIISKWTFD